VAVVLAFFEKLKDQSIDEMVYVHYPSGIEGDDDEKADRDTKNELLASDALASGFDAALELLSLADLQQITEELDLKPEPGKTKTAKKVLKKLLFEHGTSMDELEDFFNKLPTKSVNCFTNAMDVKDKNKIMDWITEKGLTLFLSQFAAMELRQWMGDIGLEAGDSSSKKLIIDAFIHGKNVDDKRPAAKSSPKLSKTKPDLAKGISAADAFQWYTVEELKAYLKKNDLPTSGRLREIAHRVADHLNGHYLPKKSLKRKRNSSSSNKKAKKAKTGSGETEAPKEDNKDKEKDETEKDSKDKKKAKAKRKST